MPAPVFPPPFDSQWGFYYLCLIFAAVCTWMTINIAGSRFGRALTAIRDAEVAAEACGIAKPKLLMLVFLFSGATAAVLAYRAVHAGVPMVLGMVGLADVRRLLRRGEPLHRQVISDGVRHDPAYA